jgi:transposase
VQNTFSSEKTVENLEEVGMKNHKVGFEQLSREEYEFLLSKRAVARKRGKLQLDRRLRAVILVGFRRMTIAQAALMCEVHPRNLSKWLALYRRGGYEELARCRHTGRKPRLTPEQMMQLEAIVLADPLAYGYESGGWDAIMVTEVILKTFGVAFSPSMVQKILRKLEFSYKLAKKNSPKRTLESGRSGWTKRCPGSSKG